MKRIMLSAMSSGSGKTTVTCALLRALQRRGISAEGFKCGPDYIDPMFHRRVLGVPCRNLDLFLQGETGLRRTLAGQTGDVAVLEGAMGFFDGVGGTEKGSAWEIAALTDTPVVLIIRPSGAGVTLAAQINGLKAFRSPDRIAGLLLNNCSDGLFHYLSPVLERECSLPVLGYLPKEQDSALESRHLGLITADEVKNFDAKIDRLADSLEAHCSIDGLLSLCAKSPRIEFRPAVTEVRCRIAVARDAAFCFYYEENMKALEAAGAELCFFSPMTDKALPQCDGLYLGGGYPELYVGQLSENRSLREEIRCAVQKGMPTVAECGGFLYLQQTLNGLPMTGVLPGNGFRTDHLQRFGYLTLTAPEDSLLFHAGERIPAHEFHYWDCTENGEALLAEKTNGIQWRCGVCTGSLYAAFPHLHFGGSLPLAERFVTKAAGYKESK